MRDLIAAVDRIHSVARGTVFATGWSAGGYLTHTIGCAMSEQLGCPAPRTRRQEAVVIATARPCRDDTEVTLVSIRGGGHDWYGPAAPFPDDALDATRASWRFFERNAR